MNCRSEAKAAPGAQNPISPPFPLLGLLLFFLAGACTSGTTIEDQHRNQPKVTEQGDHSENFVEARENQGIEEKEDEKEKEDELDLSFWTYETGESYFSETGFIEFVAGDLPLILAAPHGGYLEPDEIPPRSWGVQVRDAFTQELTREISDALFAQTGRRPHLVINLLARTRLDANRGLEEAAQENPLAEAAWAEFHQFIEEAKFYSLTRFPHALFLDIHGHGHTIQRVELGYLLSAAALRSDEEEIRDPEMIGSSSIRTLYEANADSTSFVEILRGPKSFGTLLEGQGFLSVPSYEQPAPELSWAYFSGGYNTRRWGSVEGSEMSAIQVEVNRNHRFNEENRLAMAAGLSRATREYLEEFFQISIPLLDELAEAAE